MLQRVEALRLPETALTKVTHVLDDVLPFPWQDRELFERAVAHLLEDAVPEAIEALEEAIAAQPEAYPAYHLMGHCYSRLQQWKQEVDCYKKAAKLRGNYSQVILDLALAYWIQGKEKKAFAEFKHVVSLVREFEASEFWLDFTAERLGRFKKNTGSTGPGWDAAGVLGHGFYWLGCSFLEFGLHIAARHAFKKAIQLIPDFAEAVYELGTIHIKRLRNPKRAQKHLEKAEKLFVSQGNPQRAALVHQRGHPDEPVSDPERAAEEWLKEGLRLQQLGSCQGAIDAYRMALHFRPDFVDPLYNLAIAYGSLEDTGMELIHKAVWALKRVIQIKPDYHHAHIALGASYIKQRKFEEAIDILNEGLILAPREANIHYYLGVALRVTGKLPEAVQALRRAVEINPAVHVQFYLGLTLMDLARPAEAAEVFQAVTGIKPDFADAHFILGNLYLEKLDEEEKALAHLKKAEKLYIKLEDHPRLADIRRLLAHQDA